MRKHLPQDHPSPVLQGYHILNAPRAVVEEWSGAHRLTSLSSYLVYSNGWVFYQDPSSRGIGKDTLGVKTVFIAQGKKTFKISFPVCIHSHMKELKTEAKAILTNPNPDQAGSVWVRKANSLSSMRKYFSRKKYDRIKRKLKKKGSVGGK